MKQIKSTEVSKRTKRTERKGAIRKRVRDLQKSRSVDLAQRFGAGIKIFQQFGLESAISEPDGGAFVIVTKPVDKANILALNGIGWVNTYHQMWRLLS